MARGVYSSANYFRLSSAPVSTTPLTIACWITIGTNLSTNQRFFGIYNTGGGAETTPAGFELNTQSANGTPGATTLQTASSASGLGPTQIVLDTWSHVAGVFASDASRICYLNGSAGAENTTSKTPPYTPNNVLLGARINVDSSIGGSTGTLTQLAEAAIWNVALTAAEILHLSLGYSPLFVRPESLAVYYPLIRGDASGDEPDYMCGLTMVEQGTVAVQTHTRVFYPSSPIKLGVPAAAPPAGNPWYAYAQM